GAVQGRDRAHRRDRGMSKQRALQLVEAAVWLEATGDLEGARKLYQQALKLDPSNTRAQQSLERDVVRAPKPAATPAPPPVRQAEPARKPAATPAPPPARKAEPARKPPP